MIILSNSGLIAFIVVDLIALAILIPILIVKTKKAVNDEKKMKAAGPVISRMSSLAKQKMASIGIRGNYEDYSTAGYEYFEYKTKYNYEDNMHLVIHKETKQIVYYQYIPFNFDLNKQYNDLFHYEVHNFSDLVKAEIVTNLGVVNSTSVGTGVGTGIGGVGVGVGVSNGTSTQMVNSILVTLYFKDGKTNNCNFLHNRSTAMGSDFYNSAIMEAKALLNKCELIVKGNEPKKNEDSTSKLIEYKKLLDAGVITQEEFNEKKKELLGL